MHRLPSKSPVAWTEGVTAELCDGHQKMNCATEKCSDMILLTQCYYHRGPLVFATYDPTGMLRKSRCVQFFSFKNLQYNTYISSDNSVSQ